MLKKYILFLVLIISLILSSCDFTEPAPDPLELKYLQYTDYYNGDTIALDFDITNNTNKTIVRFRPTITVYFKYDDGYGTYYPDIELTIKPGKDNTINSYWIPVCSGMVFYSSHTIDEVILWFDDGTKTTFTPNSTH